MARTRCLFSAASVLGIASLTAAQTTLHVSPAGDDRCGTGALTGARVLFQAFVLDPAAGQWWPTNAVEWAVR